MTAVRLQRFLAQAGIASRRKSEDLIAAGLVAVNGRVVTTPGTTVDPRVDRVTCRGTRVEPRHAETSAEPPIVLALHKPPGVLTARSDPAGRRTVYELVREPRGGRLAYVGRLDRETEGLLLLTSHGSLAHRLAHPRYEVERVYQADVRGDLDEKALTAGGRKGIWLPDGRTGPFRTRIVARQGRGSQALRRVEFVLTEGRNREVRRIVQACGGEVERLVRTRYAFVTLEGLPPGHARRLAHGEVDRLLATVGLPPTPRRRVRARAPRGA